MKLMFELRSLPAVPVLLLVCLLAGCGGGDVPAEVQRAPEAAATAAGDSGTLSVATFNLMFFGDDDSRNDAQYGEFGRNVRRGTEALADRLAALVDADIIAVQEIENRAALELFIAALQRRYPDRTYAGFIDDTDLPQDLALVWNEKKVRASRPRQIDRRFRYIGEEDGRRTTFARLPITADFVADGKTFALLVVHLKAAQRRDGDVADRRRTAECQGLLDWLDAQQGTAAGGHCLVLGDFNDQHGSDYAESTLTPLLQAERAGRLRFLTAPFLPPTHYTVSGTFRGRTFYRIIDHIIVPQALAEHYVAGSCRIVKHDNEQLSDHHPVLADFRF